MGSHGWGMLGVGWWWLIGILLVGLVVWIALRSANNANNNPPRSQSKSALDILKDRYARGEIDRAEFEEKKRDLLQT